MAIQKPSIPKGTRDFGPVEMSKRNYIFNIIKKVFQQHGYSQIETPAMENLDTLLGKYGEEGDKLLFRILNSGNFLSDIDHNSLIPIEKETELIHKLLEDVNQIKEIRPKPGYKFACEKDRNEVIAHFITGIISLFSIKHLANNISEKGLRYDLTVPFARYVVQNRDKIQFPFRRYQIQSVWRADRPQKGRYREFYQCDADIIGSDSLLNEIDLLLIIIQVFDKLGIRFKIKINNRKILAGISETIGYPDKLLDITTAIDKLDKIGIENVIGELRLKGIDSDKLIELQNILFIHEKQDSIKLNQLYSLLLDSKVGKKGIEELTILFDYCKKLKINKHIEFDLTLARGLNYYTGAIIEVKATDIEMGSICGGGRYDNLTGIFGLKDISGVGISFGAERIYDIMEHKGLFPSNIDTTSKILFVNFGEKEALYCLQLASNLFSYGIPTEIYPDSVKLQKQLTYANNKRIPYVVLVGENEMNEGNLTIKNMITGEQFKASPEELIILVS